jgi:hypothetical protein
VLPAVYLERRRFVSWVLSLGLAVVTGAALAQAVAVAAVPVAVPAFSD